MDDRPLTRRSFRRASDYHRLLRRMFEAAIASATPENCLPQYLPPPPAGRTVVVGAGKAAAAMARALEDLWPAPLAGLVVTAYGHSVATERVEVVEAGHPVPDAAGSEAAARILSSIQDLERGDLVLCLLSGGGSALLSLPAPGVSLEDLRSVTSSLLRSGATIAEINCVRKHLSAVTGGRLATAAFPARVLSLVMSDVPGDDPSVIASGPTVGDPTTFADALEVLERHEIETPDAVRTHLEAASDETPKPGDPNLARSEVSLVATPQQALEAAAAEAEAAGFTPVILGDSIEGEADQLALVHAGIASQVRRHGQPVAAPCVLISGGESTVTLRGTGRGGRNLQFLLALAFALDAADRVFALAGDTDGIDGTAGAAGAVISPDTLRRAAAFDLDARQMLRGNDAYSLFTALGDLVITGPTRTNVNDFRAILIAD